MTQMDGPERRDAAIIGIGCRFPVAVDGAAAFWRMLCGGRDSAIYPPIVFFLSKIAAPWEKNPSVLAENRGSF